MTASPISQPRAWLLTARLPSLLLAAAGIFMGTALAASQGRVRIDIAVFAVLTASLLQVLSNLANDYGDTVKGADEGALMPRKQMLRQGVISLANMRLGMVLCGVAAALFGVVLLLLTFGGFTWGFWLFLLLGAAALWAAVAYTATANPYGYSGFGDVMVLVFFGLVAVLGSYILQAGMPGWLELLPALTSGALAIAVLNINNLRDLDSDRSAGKHTVPVRLGRKNARRYHLLLFAIAFGCANLYTLLRYDTPWQWLFWLSLPLFVINGKHVMTQQGDALAPMLKQMVLSAAAFTLLFGLGLML
jgi:1,4-dihydroxy-2-naphthoate octaprenyltransferase